MIRGIVLLYCLIFILIACSVRPGIGGNVWQSKYVRVNKDNSLSYTPDEKGNTIPDFSRVGYYRGDNRIPDILIVKTISSTDNNNHQQLIQSAIDELAKNALNQNGFRGTILLKKGVYKIPGTIFIKSSGIVLRGEGDSTGGTTLIATGRDQSPLIHVTGDGSINEVQNSRIKITDNYVPAGAMSFSVASINGLSPGDKIIVYRQGTANWIADLKMDEIVAREGTKQWTPQEYHFHFERVITKIENNTIFIDNPIVMPMETRYGGGEIYKYNFDGRISHVGIENLNCESEYKTDTAEDHAWDAIRFDKIENGWIRNVTSRYFGFSCVNLGSYAKFITVLNCTSLDPKSKITGSRRYSFNNNGQMNLFLNCHATEGRHDYVTGARVCGPNVFYNCSAKNTHADIGPHHRWAMGTLYDNIVTDGDINIQDRGNWGSGHGWAGTTQVLWNCTARRAAVQNPWTSGKNYCIGLKGEKYLGRLEGKPDGEWEGNNNPGLQPVSLYLAQLQARRVEK